MLEMEMTDTKPTPYWQDETKHYAGNSDYWQKRALQAEAERDKCAQLNDDQSRRVYAAGAELASCKHNSGVTMDELGQMRDRAEKAEAERDKDISPCCNEWDTCQRRCAPLAENWRTAAKLSEAELAALKGKPMETPKETDPNKWAFDRGLESY